MKQGAGGAGGGHGSEADHTVAAAACRALDATLAAFQPPAWQCARCCALAAAGWGAVCRSKEQSRAEPNAPPALYAAPVSCASFFSRLLTCEGGGGQG